MSTTRCLVLLLLTATPSLASNLTAPSVEVAEPIGEIVPAPALAPMVADKARIDLLEAEIGARDALDAMRAYNFSGQQPAQNGIVRDLFEGIELESSEIQKSAGTSAWSARVGASGAWRLRARLDHVELPEGARLWVWGETETPHGFGAELIDPEGGLWTPSVDGSVLNLHLEWVGEQVPRLRISRLGQLFAQGDPFAPPATEKTACLRDATCVQAGEFTGISAARKAVAHIQFAVGSSFFVCSASLLNDTNTSTTALLFLTANHCFSSQASASSLEAFWDYFSSSCDGNWPSLASLQRSNGSTLLATSGATDVTLVRLNSAPAGRTLLGWDARAQILIQHLLLHRISHPFPQEFSVPGAQAYTRQRLRTDTGTCTGIGRPNYLYSEPLSGGAYGGSSGSPLMLASGQVVGQLRGACGPNPSDGCDFSNYHTDGSLAQSFGLLSPFLDPAPSGGPCVPGATTLCISNNPGDNRFRATIAWRSPSAQGNGGAVSTASLGITRGGMFWFFNAANPEMLVKVLNACGVNNRYWVFFAGTTNVEFTLTVTDTSTGAFKTYFNPLNNPALPIQDTTAFATCP